MTGINDGYEELIREIRNNVKESIIDEVWIEYTEAFTELNYCDYIEAVSKTEKDMNEYIQLKNLSRDFLIIME